VLGVRRSTRQAVKGGEADGQQEAPRTQSARPRREVSGRNAVLSTQAPARTQQPANARPAEAERQKKTIRVVFSISGPRNGGCAGGGGAHNSRIANGAVLRVSDAIANEHGTHTAVAAETCGAVAAALAVGSEGPRIDVAPGTANAVVATGSDAVFPGIFEHSKSLPAPEMTNDVAALAHGAQAMEPPATNTSCQTHAKSAEANPAAAVQAVSKAVSRPVATMPASGPRAVQARPGVPALAGKAKPAVPAAGAGVKLVMQSPASTGHAASFPATQVTSTAAGKAASRTASDALLVSSAAAGLHASEGTGAGASRPKPVAASCTALSEGPCHPAANHLTALPCAKLPEERFTPKPCSAMAVLPPGPTAVPIAKPGPPRTSVHFSLPAAPKCRGKNPMFICSSGKVHEQCCPLCPLPCGTAGLALSPASLCPPGPGKPL
jgi:hypothetical protein